MEIGVDRELRAKWLARVPVRLGAVASPRRDARRRVGDRDRATAPALDWERELASR